MRIKVGLFRIWVVCSVIYSGYIIYSGWEKTLYPSFPSKNYYIETNTLEVTTEPPEWAIGKLPYIDYASVRMLGKRGLYYEFGNKNEGLKEAIRKARAFINEDIYNDHKIAKTAARQELFTLAFVPPLAVLVAVPVLWFILSWIAAGFRDTQRSQ